MTTKIAISICALLILSFNAHAKTLHVAKWGVDDPTSGSTSQPFLTIGAALMNAGKNDKIVVQPGVYEESAALLFLPDTHDGVKLESVAGRHGTIMDFTAIFASSAMDVGTSKVRIGKKRKGFTIRCAMGQEAVFIDQSTSSVRVEYNRMIGCGGGGTINTAGTKTVIRGNWMEGDGYAVKCDLCVNALIDSNTILPGGLGFIFETATNASVNKNLFIGSAGVLVEQTSANIKLKDNAFVDITNDEDAIYVESLSPGGAMIEGNILSGGNRDVLRIEPNTTDSFDIKIKNNLIIDGPGSGVEVDLVGSGDPERSLIVEGNTVVQRSAGFSVNDHTNIKSFKNNNSYANTLGEGVFSNIDFVYKKHFWGDASGPDPDVDGLADNHDALVPNGSTITGSDATKPNAFKARRAAGL